MPKLHVLVGEHGEVLGTFEDTGASGGGAAPTSLGFHAGPGQRVVDVDIDEATTKLGAEELHAKIKEKHLK